MNFRYIILLLLLLVSMEIQAQTPEQSYFDWAEMPFSKEELAKRRQNLLDTLKDDGKSGLVVIPAMDGFSYGETFRQSDDFYYFTGLELPNSLLVMDLSDNSGYLSMNDSSTNEDIELLQLTNKENMQTININRMVFKFS